MAIYIPSSRRRRTLLLAAAAALAVGIGAGVLIGRGTVDSARNQVATVQGHARSTSASLRVLTLHEQAGVATASGNDIAPILQRARTDLAEQFDDAPWIGAASRDQLLARLDRLAQVADPSTTTFGAAAEELANAIDTAFGLR